MCFWILLFLISNQLHSQNLIWEKLIDFLPGQEITGSAIQESETSFVFSGASLGKSYSSRANLNGDTLWRKNTPFTTCFSNALVTSIDGDVIHFGNKDLDGLCDDVGFFVQKLNSLGTLISTWEFGDNSTQDILQNFTVIPNQGGLYLVGMKESSMNFRLSAMKIDYMGNRLWYKSYRDGTFAATGLINQKGNYVLRGSSADQPFLSVYHPYLIEINPSGDSIQSKYIIIQADSVDEITDNLGMIQNEEGNYLFSLRIDSVQSRLGTVIDRYGAIVMLDSLLNLKWKLYLGKGFNKSYMPTKIIALRDSTYIVVMMNVLPESNEFLMYNFNKFGQILSLKTFQSLICNNIYTDEIQLLNDSSLIVTGACNDGVNAYLARIGGVGLPAIVDTCKSFKASFNMVQNGDSLEFINTSKGGYAYANGSVWKFEDSTSSTLFTKKIKRTNQIDSVWVRLMATNPNGCKDTIAQKVKIINVTDTTKPKENNSWHVFVYPNPFSEATTFKILGSTSTKFYFELYNNLGQEVLEHTFTSNEFSIRKNELASGMYHYVITEKQDRVTRGKLVVE